jgi:hypothetical protein
MAIYTAPAICKRATPFGKLLAGRHIITLRFQELSMDMGCYKKIVDMEFISRFSATLRTINW